MSRQRVLVTDDDPLFRAYVAMVLRKEFLVAMAGCGEEAFAKAAEHPPDCALVDIQMPGWDGLRMLYEFRQHPILSKTPVVVISGDNTRGTVMAAITGGAADYLVKGKFDDETLLNKVKRITRWHNRMLVESAAPRPAIPSSSSPAAPSKAFVAAAVATASPLATTTPVANAFAMAKDTSPAKAAAPVATFDEEAVRSILDHWE